MWVHMTNEEEKSEVTKKRVGTIKVETERYVYFHRKK